MLMAVERSKAKVDPTLAGRYKGQIKFKDKYGWAINHVKGRDIKRRLMKL
jgi:hypothetical protein